MHRRTEHGTDKKCHHSGHCTIRLSERERRVAAYAINTTTGFSTLNGAQSQVSSTVVTAYEALIRVHLVTFIFWRVICGRVALPCCDRGTFYKVTKVT